ncbi:MAG TPA: GH3 auxin-responsive promoter family protein [Verrucomicrobiae bacterium]
MQLKATIANTLWAASNLPAYGRFRRALREPERAQKAKLRTYLEANTQSAFGKEHGFTDIRSYEEFARRVPLGDYESFEPWIARIRGGEGNVLTREAVTHLVPTSGSTAARKLIPFTAGLQREFDAAIGAWMVDLQRQAPGILGGPAYWSITPVLREAEVEESSVPIGFDSDAAYLGGAKRWLAEAVIVRPPGARDVEQFRSETLRLLMRCRELRLISVWHPSFLTLLLEKVSEYPAELWPELRVISCWGCGTVADLRRRFPNVLIQPKGLIATEAFVTLPFEGRYPLALNSHFFEFIDDRRRAHPAWELRDGEKYEVVVTTAGGLWRYRLGDRVRVNGACSLEFLGRAGNVSDRFGEKLSEAFVAEVLGEMFQASPPRFALLAPDEDGAGLRYTLYVEGEARLGRAGELDRALRRNPHYAYCRDLGQLLPARVFGIRNSGFEAFVSRQAEAGARLGDVKPLALSTAGGWSSIFPGDFVE